MKTKTTVLIIATWLTSLMLMATDNIVQAVIALLVFGASSYCLNRRKDEVEREVNKFNKGIDKLIKRQGYER